MESFRREAPRATFAARWAILDRALAAVRRGDIDLAIGVFGQIPSGLVARPLYTDEHCVIARRGHPRIDGSIGLLDYGRTGHLFVGNPDGALTNEAAIDRDTMDATCGGLPVPTWCVPTAMSANGRRPC